MSGEIIIKSAWDTRAVKEMMRQLTPPRLNQALSHGVNDAAKQVERKAEQIVAKAVSLPSKRVKKGIWIRPYSSPSTLTAVVRGSASPIPLKVFNAREKGKGVTARIWGSTKSFPGAFIFGGPAHDHNRDIGLGGHVFKRTGSSRLPIEKEPGASISEAMASEAVTAANEAYAVERLQVNVLRQLGRYAYVKAK